MILKVLGYRNYSYLYFASLLSELTTFILETAVLIHLFKITNNNNSIMGLGHALFLVFLMIGTFLGGPLGNKFNKKTILTLALILRLPLIILLMFSVNQWVILGYYGMITLLTGLFNPSRQAIINELIPPKDMPKANGLTGATIAILHLAGPLLGSQLYVYFQKLTPILIANATACLIAIFLLSRIYYDPKRRQNNSLAKELNLGFVYIKKRLDLISLFTNQVLLGLTIGILISLLLPFSREVLNGDDRVYGQLLALFGVGGLLGGPLSQWLSKYINGGKVIFISYVAEIIIFPIFIRLQDISLSYLLMFIWGTMVFIRIPTQLNHLSRSVEDEYLAQAHSVLDLSFVIPSIFGGVVVAFLGNKYSVFSLLHYASIFLMISFIIRLPFKEIWSLIHYEGEQVSREVQTN